MNFSYLKLPKIPIELIQPCIDNIALIDVDERLEQINRYRKMNKATFLTKEMSNWIMANIAVHFSEAQALQIKNSMLMNVTTYDESTFKNPEWFGSHGRHRDSGRNFAINYYISLGGQNTKIQWFDDEEKNMLEEVTAEAERWTLLKVDTIHAVRNIEKEGRRLFISMGINEEGLAEDLFKHLLDQ